MALLEDGDDEALSACPVDCPVCHQIQRPALRLATMAVCSSCTAVLAITAAGRVTVADLADRAGLTPSEWAAMVRAKSAVVAARPRRRQ